MSNYTVRAIDNRTGDVKYFCGWDDESEAPNFHPDKKRCLELDNINQARICINFFNGHYADDIEFAPYRIIVRNPTWRRQLREARKEAAAGKERAAARMAEVSHLRDKTVKHSMPITARPAPDKPEEGIYRIMKVNAKGASYVSNYDLLKGTVDFSEACYCEVFDSIAEVHRVFELINGHKYIQEADSEGNFAIMKDKALENKHAVAIVNGSVDKIADRTIETILKYEDDFLFEIDALSLELGYSREDIPEKGELDVFGLFDWLQDLKKERRLDRDRQAERIWKSGRSIGEAIQTFDQSCKMCSELI